MNKKSAQNIAPYKGGILHEVTLRTKLVFYLLADRRVSLWAKLIPIAGIAYWLWPLDLIAGLPGLSAVDDVAILWFVQYAFIEFCPSDVVRELTLKLMSNNKFVDEVAPPEEEIIDGETTDVSNKQD